jgi:hypothetical protein
MKTATLKQVKQIIKEEVDRALSEAMADKSPEDIDLQDRIDGVDAGMGYPRDPSEDEMEDWDAGQEEEVWGDSQMMKFCQS